MKECRVCGKKYIACHTPNVHNIFRWRDVACSPECGAKYLEMVASARSKDATAAQTDANPDVAEPAPNEESSAPDTKESEPEEEHLDEFDGFGDDDEDEDDEEDEEE